MASSKVTVCKPFRIDSYQYLNAPASNLTCCIWHKGTSRTLFIERNAVFQIQNNSISPAGMGLGYKSLVIDRDK